jgi:signal transduction histidine kinase
VSEQAIPAAASADLLFAGPGEVRACCRAFDWATTPLGPVEGWSYSLRTTVGTLLACRNPMFLWWGPDLVQIYNDAYRPSFGLSGRHPAAIGMRGRECWTDIWETIGPQIMHVMAGGEATWHEDQYIPILRNGQLEDVWWTYGYSAVRDDDGTIGGTLVVCQETTPRIIAERDRERLLVAAEDDDRERRRLLAALEVERSRLAYVFQQAPSFLAILRGPTYVFELVNEAYYQLMGRRELIGKPVWEALPEVRGQGFEERLDGVVATGEPFLGRAVPMTVARTPGAPPEERFIDLTYMPLVEGDGMRTGIIAHGTDVTEHVHARREIERLLADTEQALFDTEVARADAEEARAEAESSRAEGEVARTAAVAANRSKGEFLAIMSHELRTPLNAIAGYAELLAMGIRGPVTPQQREDLARIQKSQRHLLGLVNGVLNYSRAEAGTVYYDISDVPLEAVLVTCETLIAPQARAKQITLQVVTGDEPLTVRGDREKLQQIVVNLLSNAVKFTAAGGEVTLACGRTRGPGGETRVLVTVADTGRGIAADALERIFEPFVQVDTRLTRTEEGVGLGLAISRDLARGMAGDLSVESTLGVGSTFTLSLRPA